MANHYPIYRFGTYELHPQTRQLLKHGTRIKLRPQPFQILTLLVERSGEVVTREELRQLLWSKETFVDFEHGLNTAIRELRAVLNDSAAAPRYIETAPKHGYRILIPVHVDAPAPANGASVQLPVPSTENLAVNIPHDNAEPPFAIWRWRITLALSFFVIVGIAVYLRWMRPATYSHSSSARMMLAVLPFENLTGDAGQDYFSDGLTEEMITQIGRLDPQQLGVIARTSVMHYKNHRESFDEIGRKLGVQYVLEGSVRRDSGKVRITAQLIQVEDQSPLWAKEYDRELNNLLSVQGEISQELAGEIQHTLHIQSDTKFANQPSSIPKNSEAYDLYLKGRYSWNKRTPLDLQQAIQYFQKAADQDPSYAQSYSGLAQSYALLGGYRAMRQDEYIAKAREAALRAVQIDDRLPEAHTALAIIAQNYDHDWNTAEKEYRRAIELDANYATAHQWYAESMAMQGRFAEAFPEMERARQLDPLSLIIATDYGTILYFSRQYDRAIAQFRTVLEMEPNFLHAHMVEYAYIEKGQYDNALSDLESWQKVETGPWSWGTLAYAYGRSGKPVQARQAFRKLEEMAKEQQIDPGPLVIAYVGMNDKDHAFQWLEKAYSQHSNLLATIKVDPLYDPLRSDERFQNLLQRAGLAE